jgi:hypothetical protein
MPPAETPDAGATTPDAAATPDAAVAACSVRAEQTSLSVREGGRVRVALAFDPGAVLTATTTSPGFVATIEGTTLTIEPPYGSAGAHTFAIAAECAGAREETEVALEVQKIAAAPITPWSGTAGPAAREHPLLWIDAADPDRLLLFGGYLFEPRQYTPAWDLWALDLASDTWSELQTTTPAPHRSGGRIAAVADQPLALLYGGDDEQMNIAYSMWRLDYDALTWTEEPLLEGQAPGAILHSFVYDAPRDRFISACGYTGDDIHCDVQEYVRDANGGRWRTLEVAPGDVPSGRYGFFYALDAETDRLIIFSGAQWPTRVDPVNPAQDTWALELAEDPPRWVKLAGEEGPPGRRNGAFVLDPEGHRLFVFGGTPDARTTSEGLWALDLDRGRERWTRVEVDNEPPNRSSSAGVYDPQRRRMLVGFGNTTRAEYADLWAFQL